MSEQNTTTDISKCDKLNAEQSDVETISANTEDSLLNTRSNSETKDISMGSKKSCCAKKENKCCSCCGLATGLILSVLGVLMLIWTPFNIVMDQRLDMTPGLPAFEWWKTPPDNVLLLVNIFNVTNADAFQNGSDAKIRMQQVGPIIYREKLVHTNISFNNNGTLSYTAVRTPIYVPEMNTIDINSTIVIPNYALLGVASYLHDYSLLTKYGFNFIRRGTKSPVFLNITVYNFLWNFTDPILTLAKHLVPTVVPSDNMGMLHTIYRNIGGRSTVYIGMKHGHHKFFGLDKFEGTVYLPGHGEECGEMLLNATEGALYPQYINKNMSFGYWRKTLCRVIPLHYQKESFMEDYNVLAYKFVKPNNVYDRRTNLSQDCHKGVPVLPDGLSDVSKCYNGIPMAASFPHFLHGNEVLRSYVDGLEPNESLHDSFAYIEPLTGIPIISTARSQSNMVIRDMASYKKDLHKFSNVSIPMFWLEYRQTGLPYYVKALMNFTVVVLPHYQYCFITAILIIGISLLVIYIRRIVKWKKKDNYKQNANLQFEQEVFLKQS